MSSLPIVVRPLASQEEYDLYFRMVDAAFSDSPSEEGTQRWQRIATHDPEFRPEQLCGAFRAGQQMGGYLMQERLLCMGATHISTGCIAGVVTFPEYRKQGVASALMQDAITFAGLNNQHLLLLDGIPNFYYRFGYTDMFDVTVVDIDCAAILNQPAASYIVRESIVEDAADMLALYNRYQRAYTGSFERSLEQQTYLLRNAQTPPTVVLAHDGHAIGYLMYGRGADLAQGREVAADNWDALLALLQHHVHLLDEKSVASNLNWRLPSTSPLLHWVIDRLEVPDTSKWHTPANEWSVRSMTYAHRFAGWMGRLINFTALMHALLPELQSRWQRSLARWTGAIKLTVVGESCVVQIDGAALQLAPTTSSVAYQIELTPQAFIQLIFGYRPLSELSSMANLPLELGSVCSILFPQGHTWIPGTDWF